jgi:hypothetical protein
VAISGMVGMFSKQATNRLDDLFSTMFKSEKNDRSLKNKLQYSGSGIRFGADRESGIGARSRAGAR